MLTWLTICLQAEQTSDKDPIKKNSLDYIEGAFSGDSQSAVENKSQHSSMKIIR